MPTLMDSRPAERYFRNRPVELKPKGRPRLALNKTHTSVRLALLEAYRLLGGIDGLVKWGRESPDLFYPMLRALLPHELAEQQAKDGSGIRVLVYAPQTPSDKPLEINLTHSAPVEADDTQPIDIVDGHTLE